jgi:hypothetical protein
MTMKFMKEATMKRVLSLALVGALVVPFVAHAAQAKPNFAGTWTLDAARSDPGRGGGGGGGGRGGGGPVEIKQSATEITIGMATYKLDGSEVQIQGRGGITQKAKATWDGAKLVITTNMDFQGQAVTQRAVRTLSADGKEMTVETEIEGMGTRKQVYTKN